MPFLADKSVFAVRNLMSLVDYREPIAIQNDFHPVQIRTILSFVFLENVAKSFFEFRCNMHLSLVLEVFRRDNFEMTVFEKSLPCVL